MNFDFVQEARKRAALVTSTTARALARRQNKADDSSTETTRLDIYRDKPKQIKIKQDIGVADSDLLKGAPPPPKKKKKKKKIIII